MTTSQDNDNSWKEIYLPPPDENGKRVSLARIARDTLAVIEAGRYFVGGTAHDISQTAKTSVNNTKYYPPDSFISEWSSKTRGSFHSRPVRINFEEISTLAAARSLASEIAAGTVDTLSPDESTTSRKIGILNFASAKSEGGGFLSGSRAQEESIARSSTLYPTLKSTIAQQFYELHRCDPRDGSYSHAMVYSPGVSLIRTDHGEWRPPVTVDVLSSAAVNAGVFRRSKTARSLSEHEVEARIEEIMLERMARILLLFEENNVTDVVLGAFGTGAFKNNVDTIGRIWGQLLGREEGRFSASFQTVTFAVLWRETFVNLQSSFIMGSKG